MYCCGLHDAASKIMSRFENSADVVVMLLVQQQTAAAAAVEVAVDDRSGDGVMGYALEEHLTNCPQQTAHTVVVLLFEPQWKRANIMMTCG